VFNQTHRATLRSIEGHRRAERRSNRKSARRNSLCEPVRRQARLTMPKILLLTRYDRLGASSRVRFLQFLPALRAEGFDFDIRPFFGDDYVRALYGGSKISIARVVASYGRRMAALLQARRYDLVWLEKEALPWMPAWLESILLKGVPYVVDYDDAWFHRYDQQRSSSLRALLGGKIDAVMRKASVVVVGNDYLAKHARQAGARKIVLIPTSINLGRYPSASSLDQSAKPAESPIVVGWIGTPVTAPYLASIEPAFRAVAKHMPAALRIIGAELPAVFEGLNAETTPWSEATEISDILKLDIGIMPLADTPWEQGKCAYKLLQIMAAGRPVIASAVGANCQVVQHGVNGFLATSTGEWVTALKSLISDPALRHRLGAAGRQTVEHGYSTQKALASLVSVLKDAIGGTGGTN
jgi:glycosyltransferase involved in cell wall biosynthesis